MLIVFCYVRSNIVALMISLSGRLSKIHKLSKLPISKIIKMSNLLKIESIGNAGNSSKLLVGWSNGQNRSTGWSLRFRINLSDRLMIKDIGRPTGFWLQIGKSIVDWPIFHLVDWSIACMFLSKGQLIAWFP